MHKNTHVCNIISILKHIFFNISNVCVYWHDLKVEENSTLTSCWVWVNQHTDIHRGLWCPTVSSNLKTQGEQILSLDLIMYSSIIKAFISISARLANTFPVDWSLFYPHSLSLSHSLTSSPFLPIVWHARDTGANELVLSLFLAFSQKCRVSEQTNKLRQGIKNTAAWYHKWEGM